MLKGTAAIATGLSTAGLSVGIPLTLSMPSPAYAVYLGSVPRGEAVSKGLADISQVKVPLGVEAANAAEAVDDIKVYFGVGCFWHV